MIDVLKVCYAELHAKTGVWFATAVDAARILDGIHEFLERYGWARGYRNDMAVNICVACWTLDLDPWTVFVNYLDPLGCARDDFHDRLRIISKYKNRWDPEYLDFANKKRDFLGLGTLIPANRRLVLIS